MFKAIYRSILIAILFTVALSACSGVKKNTRNGDEACVLEAFGVFEIERQGCELQIEAGLDSCGGSADCEYDVFMEGDACDWAAKENLYLAAIECSDAGKPD